MAFTRYKKIYNNTYAYDVWKEKDENGKWRQKSKYLGVVTDMEKKTYERKRKAADCRRILDFGDSYALNEIVSTLPIFGILRNVFGDMFDTLIALVFYRITGGGAFVHAQNWYEGNYVSKLFPNARVTSQQISDFLAYLGNESVKRAFFASYIPLVCNETTGVVIDSTGLPNEIDMPVTDWGHHGGGVAFETRFILAVEREHEQPLYFRYVNGSVGDVSTLQNTLVEMKNNGIVTSSVLMDAGYYSEANLRALFVAQITFLIRMPSNRTEYKRIIAENADIESPQYAENYDKRGLFIKENVIDMYGYTAYAYLVLDPERRGREISKAVIKMNDEGLSPADVDFSACGKMVLLSSVRLAAHDVVPLYYTRQVAEKMFGIAKDDLGILPLRTHSEPNFNGFMLLTFISLIFHCAVKERLGKKISVEQAVSLLKNLRCKVYDNSIATDEVTKKQRTVFEAANVLVPKICGV